MFSSGNGNGMAFLSPKFIYWDAQRRGRRFSVTLHNVESKNLRQGKVKNWVMESASSLYLSAMSRHEQKVISLCPTLQQMPKTLAYKLKILYRYRKFYTTVYISKNNLSKNSLSSTWNTISFTRDSTLLFLWRCCLICCSCCSPLRAKWIRAMFEINFLYRLSNFLYTVAANGQSGESRKSIIIGLSLLLTYYRWSTFKTLKTLGRCHTNTIEF